MQKPLLLTHHATLLVGDISQSLNALAEMLTIDFRAVPDPDIIYVNRDALTIDDVRELSFRVLQKPIAHDSTLVIVATHTINTEAQNALLKLTEDPPPHVRFVFVLPWSLPLIPTLRSRFNILHTEDKLEKHTPRLTPLIEALAHSAQVAKDKDDAGMERILRESESRVHAEKQGGRAAHALLLARRYIEARGSSPKMLLEHLAIAEREDKR